MASADAVASSIATGKRAHVVDRALPEVGGVAAVLAAAEHEVAGGLPRGGSDDARLLAAVDVEDEVRPVVDADQVVPLARAGGARAGRDDARARRVGRDAGEREAVVVALLQEEAGDLRAVDAQTAVRNPFGRRSCTHAATEKAWLVSMIGPGASAAPLVPLNCSALAPIAPAVQLAPAFSVRAVVVGRVVGRGRAGALVEAPVAGVDQLFDLIGRERRLLGAHVVDRPVDAVDVAAAVLAAADHEVARRRPAVGAGWLDCSLPLTYRFSVFAMASIDAGEEVPAVGHRVHRPAGDHAALAANR